MPGRMLVNIIHDSCESFYDWPDRSSPRITSIAVPNPGTAQATSFSIHRMAERRGFSPEELGDLRRFGDVGAGAVHAARLRRRAAAATPSSPVPTSATDAGSGAVVDVTAQAGRDCSLRKPLTGVIVTPSASGT